jgi:hypothetical protein
MAVLAFVHLDANVINYTGSMTATSSKMRFTSYGLPIALISSSIIFSIFSSVLNPIGSMLYIPEEDLLWGKRHKTIRYC